MQGKRPGWENAYKHFIEENFEKPEEFLDDISSFLKLLYNSGNPNIKESILKYADLSLESWERFNQDGERMRRLENGTTKWICILLTDDGADAPEVVVKATLSGPCKYWVELEISVEFNLF